MRGIIAIALVAVGFFLGIGTYTNVSETGPEILSFLDLRWWWHLGDIIYTWFSSAFSTPGFNGPDMPVPEGRIEE